MEFLVKSEGNIDTSSKKVSRPLAKAKSGSSSMFERSIVEFPALQVLDVDNVVQEIEEYAYVFDESMRMVRRVIFSDIWPRFMKSASYEAAVKAYTNEINSEAV
jgi:hypothetical protein